MIQAIIFDFDGLIFDTETHEYKALQEIFTEYNAVLPLDIWGKCVGTRAGTFDAHPIDVRLQSMAEIALEQLLDKIASSSET